MDRYIIRKDVYNEILLKSFGLDAESIEKARALPDGTIREWNGVKYKKISGKWLPLAKGRKAREKEAIKPKGSKATGPEKTASKAEEKTYTFTKLGHVYNVPATSPEEAVKKLASRGVKGFKPEDASDDSKPRSKESTPEEKNSKDEESSKVESFKKDDIVELKGKEGQFKVVSQDQDGSYHVVSLDGKTGFKASMNFITPSSIKDSFKKGDIVQFKDTSGKNHNGTVLMEGEDTSTIVDNVTKVTYEIPKDKIKVLAKGTDKDSIRDFYNAGNTPNGWRDGTQGLQPEECDSIEGLLSKAQETWDEFRKTGADTVKFFNEVLGVDSFYIPRKSLKGEGRIKEKLREDAKAEKDELKRKNIYDEEKDIYNCSTIRDADGCTYTCNSIDDIVKIFNYFKEKPEIVRMKNNFANPTDAGYSDVNMNIRLSNGTIAEIQLNTTANIVAKEKYGHAMYEVYRSVKSDPEYRELTGFMEEGMNKLYGLSNSYSKNGNFPKLTQDQVYGPYKHEPYAQAVRDYIAKAMPLYKKAVKAGKLEEKTVKSFENLIAQLQK